MKINIFLNNEDDETADQYFGQMDTENRDCPQKNDFLTYKKKVYRVISRWFSLDDNLKVKDVSIRLSQL